MIPEVYDEQLDYIKELGDLEWSYGLVILDYEEMEKHGFIGDGDFMENNQKISDLWDLLHRNEMHMGVANKLVHQGQRVEIKMYADKTIDTNGDELSHRHYETFVSEFYYMPYVMQIELSLGTGRIFVVENFRLTMNIWDLFSNIGGLFSIVSGIVNVVLFICLIGIWFPKCYCMNYSRKVFGYADLPCNFKTRRQTNAFFEVFGGKIGKDLLVREENLEEKIYGGEKKSEDMISHKEAGDMISIKEVGGGEFPLPPN